MENWEKRLIYPRPDEERPVLERAVQVGVSCPSCSAENVARYPVANHQGARMLVRCQTCFHILSLERPAEDDLWPPFRSVSYDWEASLSERASRNTLGSA